MSKTAALFISNEEAAEIQLQQKQLTRGVIDVLVSLIERIRERASTAAQGDELFLRFHQLEDEYAQGNPKALIELLQKTVHLALEGAQKQDNVKESAIDSVRTSDEYDKIHSFKQEVQRFKTYTTCLEERLRVAKGALQRADEDREKLRQSVYQARQRDEATQAAALRKRQSSALQIVLAERGQQLQSVIAERLQQQVVSNVVEKPALQQQQGAGNLAAEKPQLQRKSSIAIAAPPAGAPHRPKRSMTTTTLLVQSNHQQSLNTLQKPSSLQDMRQSLHSAKSLGKIEQDLRRLKLDISVHAQQIRYKDIEAYQFEIKKLEQRVKDSDHEKQKAENEVEQLHEKLKQMYQERQEWSVKKWVEEVKDPSYVHNLAYYREQLALKNRELGQMKRQIRKYNILERQLLVKSKAFECERAEYHEQILNYDQRVTKLSQLYQDTSTKLSKVKERGLAAAMYSAQIDNQQA